MGAEFKSAPISLDKSLAICGMIDHLYTPLRRAVSNRMMLAQLSSYCNIMRFVSAIIKILQKNPDVLA
jgi:hypothetical protein